MGIMKKNGELIKKSPEPYDVGSGLLLLMN
jgi:hypothetical protein